MPGFTGLEVLEELRGEHCPPPYMLITAFSSTELRDEAKSAGAVAVLSKPFDMDDLRVAVQYFIGRPRL
jgi:CheY-like chemotaxis protein